MNTIMNIKKATYLIIYVILIITVTGCEDFLKENPKNFINPQDFYENQSDAESGLSGVYANMLARGIYTRHGSMAHVMYSDYTWPWSLSQESGYNATPEFWLFVIWDDNYEGIKRANNFIESLEAKKVNFSENLKNRYIAEAKFLRVLNYTYLLQWYGGVPIVTSTVMDNYLVERDSESEGWDFVEAELNEVIPILPHKSEYLGMDVSRANKEAAKMALTKVYMVRQKWSEAKVLVEEIISSGEYQLETDILDNWNTSNEHGIESIYEVDCGSGFNPKLGNTLGGLGAPEGLIHPITGKIMGGAFTGVGFSPFFYDMFDTEDTRRTKCFYDTAMHGGPKGRFFCSKYFDPKVMQNFVTADNPTNFVVFRYADVLLMKAEIENELNNGPNVAAYQAIDAVRDRSNAPKLNRNFSYKEFLDAVFDERGRELFYEGHRFYDLKRRGYEFLKNRVEPARQALFDYVKYPVTFSIAEKNLKLPIPQTEIDANPKLVQNPY